MDLYSTLIDDDYKALKPNHEFEGELVHNAIADESVGENLRFVTSVVKRRNGLWKLNIYINGKKYTSKRFEREKPVIQESYTLIDAVIMDMKMRRYERS